MTDEELVLVIDEMREDDPQGIIRENGIVRSKCKMFPGFFLVTYAKFD